MCRYGNISGGFLGLKVIQCITSHVSGKRFYPISTSCGVIRNQRRKLRRSMYVRISQNSLTRKFEKIWASDLVRVASITNQVSFNLIKAANLSVL